ncbi:hypothetical protein [Kitasatospora sp. LaBMicrA B282]|uniref:hypothetical protein n=1 Tax=Kitasatospora sp. LaBMicrA B282 TaxID=3420949 RepID=UPI003D0EFC69
MITTDLPLLLQRLKEEFADVSGMSVALSGSLARGDHRTGRGGHIASDLDLIPVVACATDAPAARAALEPILQRLAATFRIEATAAITTRDAFRNAAYAPYRTSMRRQWLTDGLALGEDAFAQPAVELHEVLPWTIQPITYYLAKATEADPGTNIAKARRAACRLPPGAAIELPDRLHDLPRALCDLINERRLVPLDSTALYLDAPSRPTIASQVRDAVFRENQGLPVRESAVTAQPPPLN